MGGQKYKTCFGNNKKITVGEGKRRAITLKEKLEVIKRFERSERTCDIVRATGIKESTLRTIRDSAEKIKASIDAGTSLSASKSVRMRPKPIEEMEQILRVWIEGQTKRRSEISFSVVKQKALSTYRSLKKKYNNPSDVPPFSASTGWFTGFRNRHALHNLSTGSQQSKSSTTTTKTALGPRELLLPNIETELPEQIEFASSQIENINEIKEEVQDDQPDCSVTMIVNESQLPDITHQEADSIIMDTCQPSSKRLLDVPEHQYRMMSSLASMWKEQRMCDASIGNGTTIIKVHKVVLLAISPTLLSSSEVRNDCFLRVNFPANISENAMRAFAEYMYNGVLDLDPLTLTQLQQISYQLGIEELCLLCETHLYSPTQDPDNIICPGTSLSHLATQSDTSSLQISLHHSSGPGVKNRHALTNSWGQSSQGQDFIRSGPAPIKTEPQDSVPVYGSRSSGFQTRSARIPNMAWSVSEATTHSRGFSSVAKASKTPKTFQEHSRALESPVISQIKMEPFDQKELEYSLHRPSLSSESSISNRLPTKSDRIRATTNCSDQSKLVSGTSPVIGTVSNLQQKFSKNQMKAVATPPISLSLSSGNKVVRPNHDDPSLRTIVGNNSFNSGLRSKHSTSDMPYPVMLFSSGEETVPINISQMEQYIDLTSS